MLDSDKEVSMKNEQTFSLKREVFEWLETIAFSLVAVVLIFTFVFESSVLTGIQ